MHLCLHHVVLTLLQLCIGFGRIAMVTKDGKYVHSDKPRQLGYGAMVFVRQGIVIDASTYLSRAVTIAVRYSCVRRQFGTKGEPGERQVSYIFWNSMTRTFLLDQKICVKH
jgi:hypothetical protein